MQTKLAVHVYPPGSGSHCRLIGCTLKLFAVSHGGCVRKWFTPYQRPKLSRLLVPYPPPGTSPGAGLESAFDQADAAFADLIVTSVDSQGVDLDDEVGSLPSLKGTVSVPPLANFLTFVLNSLDLHGWPSMLK